MWRAAAASVDGGVQEAVGAAHLVAGRRLDVHVVVDGVLGRLRVRARLLHHDVHLLLHRLLELLRTEHNAANVVRVF